MAIPNFETLETFKGSNIRTYVAASKMEKQADLVNQLYAAEEVSVEESMDTEEHVFQGMTTKGYIPTVTDYGVSFDIVHTKDDTAFNVLKEAHRNKTTIYFLQMADYTTGEATQCRMIITKFSTKFASAGTITTSIELKPALGSKVEDITITE